MVISMAVWIGFTLCALGCLSDIESKVLLISMDGFRWDYIEQNVTPNFDKFAQLGTKAPYIKNTFITKTFPCHYSIATGLYEESHGIVDDFFYDPVRKQLFRITSGSTEGFWWNGGEPIWNTVQKHGLRSGVYYWPGSEAEIRGVRPNIYYNYNQSVTFEDRINTVMSWLSNDTYDIDLAMLYFHEPDYTGHEYGPMSDEVKLKVEEMDSVLGDIVRKMDDLKLWDNVNVIVTSGHGMAEVDQAKRGIDLSQFIDLLSIDQYSGGGPTMTILPKPGLEDKMFANLSVAPHLAVYRKANIPDFWHYKNNDRILPLLLVAEEGWLIGRNLKTYVSHIKGNHGFDNRLPSMKPIFFARGPNIRAGHISEPFRSVDIYPLVCKLLGIHGAQVNGTLENTKDFVTTPTSVIG